MGSIVDGVKTANAAVRTMLLAVLVAGLGLSGFWGYNEYTKRERLLKDKDAEIQLANQRLVSLTDEIVAKDSTIQELGREVQQQAVEIDKLGTALHLLKVDQRLAMLKVTSIERNEEGIATTSKLEFTELSPQGEPLSAPKQFELPGDVIYIDNWVVKFDDSYIEKADIERGTSLCLFRRIFSDQQTPNEGISLDTVGMRPQAYARGGATTKFEAQLWSEFWEFANDPKKAAEMGIRAAHGEAVSIKVREGNAYHIQLRASGGLSINPIAK